MRIADVAPRDIPVSAGLAAGVPHLAPPDHDGATYFPGTGAPPPSFGALLQRIYSSLTPTEALAVASSPEMRALREAFDRHDPGPLRFPAHVTVPDLPTVAAPAAAATTARASIDAPRIGSDAVAMFGNIPDMPAPVDRATREVISSFRSEHHLTGSHIFTADETRALGAALFANATISTYVHDNPAVARTFLTAVIRASEAPESTTYDVASFDAHAVLPTLIQADSLDATHTDGDRCVASQLLAQAVMGGWDAVQAFATRVDHLPGASTLTPAEHRFLRGLAARETGSVSVEDLHRLQDLAFRAMHDATAAAGIVVTPELLSSMGYTSVSDTRTTCGLSWLATHGGDSMSLDAGLPSAFLSQVHDGESLMLVVRPGSVPETETGGHAISITRRGDHYEVYDSGGFMHPALRVVGSADEARALVTAAAPGGVGAIRVATAIVARAP